MPLQVQRYSPTYIEIYSNVKHWDKINDLILTYLMCDATSDAFYALASKRGIVTDFSSSLRNMGEGFKQVLNFPN